MFKVKKSTLIAVVVTFLVTVTGLYASGRVYTNKSLDELKNYVDAGNQNLVVVDAEQMVLMSRYNETVKQYNESRKQSALLKNQMERLNYDTTQHVKKRQQQQLIEKYQLQVEYYSVCLSIKQLELANSELEVLNKQILVEEEKLNQGDSTQLIVDDLVNKRQQAQDKLYNLSNRIEQGKNDLKVRLNETSDVQFDPSFSIPVTVEGNDPYTLSSLKTQAKSNNRALLQLNAYIGFHTTLLSTLNEFGENDTAYVMASSERVKLQADANVLSQYSDSAIERHYNQFKQSLLTYTTQQGRKVVLGSQQVVLDTKYANGDISELQYLAETYAVLTSLYDVDEANVGKLNALALMQLITQGIILD